MCGKLGFKSKEINVDHIIPVVDPIKGFESIEIFIENLFCDENNLQILCVSCHSQKTALENTNR